MQIDLNLTRWWPAIQIVMRLRKLFSELEFTTLLKELIPALEVKETDYRELKSIKDLKALASSRSTLAVAFDFVLAAKAEEEPKRRSNTPRIIFHHG